MCVRVRARVRVCVRACVRACVYTRMFVYHCVQVGYSKLPPGSPLLSCRPRYELTPLRYVQAASPTTGRVNETSAIIRTTSGETKYITVRKLCCCVCVVTFQYFTRTHVSSFDISHVSCHMDSCVLGQRKTLCLAT